MHPAQRKSYHSTGNIYFFTATIHNWYNLLESYSNKTLITNYLKKLSEEDLLTIYAFVVMPNHVHIIWKQNKLNGKETPQGSFLKYTAHELLKTLTINGQSALYKVNAANKKHQIWQRDSLSIEVYSRHVALQKLQYIHANPVSKKWKLAENDISYYWSSARFYETGVDDFGFLNNLLVVFDGV